MPLQQEDIDYLVSQGLNPDDYDLDASGDNYVPRTFSQPAGSSNTDFPQPKLTPQTYGPLGTATGTFLHEAPSSVAGGIGFAQGAKLGSKLPGPWPVKVGGGLVGGVAGGLITGGTARKVQDVLEQPFVDAALDPTVFNIGKILLKLRASQAANPKSALAGSIATMPLAGMSPSPSNVGRAFQYGIPWLAGHRPPIEQISNIANVGVGAALQPAIGIGQRLATGEPITAENIGWDTLLGAVFNRPNVLGRAYGFGPAMQSPHPTLETIGPAPAEQIAPTIQTMPPMTATEQVAVGGVPMGKGERLVRKEAPGVSAAYAPADLTTRWKQTPFPADVELQRMEGEGGPVIETMPIEEQVARAAERSTSPTVRIPTGQVAHTPLETLPTYLLSEQASAPAKQSRPFTAFEKEVNTKVESLPPGNLARWNEMLAQWLGSRRGVTSIEADAKLPIAGDTVMSWIGDRLKSMAIRLGPKSGFDTLPHEGLHGFFGILRTSPKSFDKLIVNRGERIIENLPEYKAINAERTAQGREAWTPEEFLVSEAASEYVQRQMKVTGETPFKQWWNDFQNHLKVRFSNKELTQADLRRYFNYRYQHDAAFKRFADGGPVPRGITTTAQASDEASTPALIEEANRFGRMPLDEFVGETTGRGKAVTKLAYDMALRMDDTAKARMQQLEAEARQRTGEFIRAKNPIEAMRENNRVQFFNEAVRMYDGLNDVRAGKSIEQAAKDHGLLTDELQQLSSLRSDESSVRGLDLTPEQGEQFKERIYREGGSELDKALRGDIYADQSKWKRAVALSDIDFPPQNKLQSDEPSVPINSPDVLNLVINAEIGAKDGSMDTDTLREIKTTLLSQVNLPEGLRTFLDEDVSVSSASDWLRFRAALRKEIDKLPKTGETPTPAPTPAAPPAPEVTALAATAAPKPKAKKPPTKLTPAPKIAAPPKPAVEWHEPTVNPPAMAPGTGVEPAFETSPEALEAATETKPVKMDAPPPPLPKYKPFTGEAYSRPIATPEQAAKLRAETEEFWKEAEETPDPYRMAERIRTKYNEAETREERLKFAQQYNNLIYMRRLDELQPIRQFSEEASVRRVVAAAIMTKDGRVFKGEPGSWHYTVPFPKDEMMFKKGFVDNTGAFLTRKEALKIAHDAGQLYERADDQYLLGRIDELDSAHLKNYAQSDQASIRRQTETSEFKQWFGNSKVVDNEGKPLVVYHLTGGRSIVGSEGKGSNWKAIWGNKNIDKFDSGHFGTINQANQHGFGAGIMNTDVAPAIYPVYLSIKNPKRVDDVKNNWRPVIEQAKKEGYDGLVYKNKFEPDDPVNDTLQNWDKYVEESSKESDADKISESALMTRILSKDQYWMAQRNRAIKDGAVADSYVAFYPEQIKSAIGNRGTFDATNPDIRKSEESPFYATRFGKVLSPLAPDIEKVRIHSPEGAKAATGLEDFYRRQSRLRGELEQRLIRNLLRTRRPTNLKEFWTQDNEDYRAVTRWLDIKSDGDTPNFTLTPKQKEIEAVVRESLLKSHAMREERPRLKHKTSADPYYLPHTLSREAATELANNPTSAKSMAYFEDFIQYHKKVNKMTRDEALKAWKIVRGAFTKEAHNLAQKFGPIDESSGIGLPRSMREQNLMDRMARFNRRYARRIAYHDAIETNKDVSDALFNKEKGMESNEYAKNVLEDIYGVREHQEAKRNAALGVVRAGMLGPLTGAKDFVSNLTLGMQHQDASQVIPAIKSALENYRANYDRAINKGSVRYNISGLEMGDGGITQAVNFLQRARDVINTGQGRQLLETATRIVAFGQGRYLAVDALDALRNKNLTFQKTKFLKDFVPEWEKYRNAPADEAVINEAAANYVDSVQGTYDYRGQPNLTMKGSFAPILSLARWNVEKFNNFVKHNIEPARQGNWKPLLMSTVGMLIGGTAVNALVEQATGRKERTPEWKEIGASEEKIGLTAYKLAGLSSMAGYAGIIGDALRSVMDVRYKNRPQLYNNPLIDAMGSAAENFNFLIDAMQEGDIPAATDVMNQILQDYFQAYRLAIAHLSPEERAELEKRSKMRDQKMFKAGAGLPLAPYSSETPNPYIDKEMRQFKRTGDVGEAIELLPELIEKAIEDSNGDPEQLKAEFLRLKINNYQTMPNPETMPKRFWDYYMFLAETQGEKEAAARLEDFIVQNTVNKAKAKMIP